MKYKYIQHEVMSDAPFIGALIVANDCSRNCKECFNQDLKQIESTKNAWYEIEKKVKSNGLNKGIILGGLEWTEQPNDLLNLMVMAREDFKVMIYTGLTEEQFLRIPDVKEVLSFNLPIYVKYGSYESNNKCENNIYYGVKLASCNQYIKYYGR